MNNKKVGNTQCDGYCKKCEWHCICPHDPATWDSEDENGNPNYIYEEVKPK